MPRITIDTSKGQYTNTDEFASGLPGQIVNLLVDEHGTLTSRPGLEHFCTATDDTAGLGGSTDQNIIAVHPYLDRLVAVSAHRRIKLIDEDGNVEDLTPPYLEGSKQPTFHLSPDGSLYVFGGGAPKRIRPDFSAEDFAVGLEGSPTHGTTVDSTLCVNLSGTDVLQYSDIADYTLFTPQAGEAYPGRFRANRSSDAITAIAQLQGRLFCFGERSCEVFYGTGGQFVDGIRYAFRAEDEPMQSEIIAPYSLLDAAGTLWWLDGDRSLVRLEGRSAQPVSLPVWNQLKGMSSVSDCVTHHMLIQGHHLIVLFFKAAGITLVYDYARQVWTEWRRWDAVNGEWAPMPLQGYAYHPQWDRHFCAGYGTSSQMGYIYELSEDAYDDVLVAATSTSPLVRLWRGPAVDGGNFDLKFAKRLQFLVDGGTATSHTSADDDYNPVVEVRWRNDDRQWQDWRPMQLGRIGHYDTVRDVWCTTNFRRQQVEWRCSAPVALRVNRIELEVRERTR